MRQRGLLLVLLAATAGNVQATEPRPGLWNLTITISAEGAAQPYGPYYSSQCFSPDDVRNPESLLAGAGGPDCTYSDVKNQANRFAFNVQCSGAVPMSGSGTVDYSGDTFQGDVNITADLNGLPIATRNHVVGSRAGDCPPDRQ